MNLDDSHTTDGHGSPDEATPFHDLENFVALPRLSGLTMNSDGSRLVTSVATLNPKRTGYATALWDVDPSGERPAHRLTHSAEGESGAAFLATGDLLFTSARPDPGNGADDAGKQASLWRLAARGGEAELLHSRPGGISSVATAAHADTAVVVADVLAGASGEAEDAERRTARKDTGVAAILHSGYPVRYWDADLGPGEPRYFRLEADAEDEPLVPLAEGIGAGLRDSHPEVSPDGAMLFTALRLPEALGSQRSALARIDVATGERTVLVNEAGFDAAPGPVSPDGRTVVVICNRRTSADTSPRTWLALLPVQGGDLIPLAKDWDRWPAPAAWLPDGSGILVTADDDGAAPVFAIDTTTGAVRRITTDAAAYSDISVSPDGTTAYGLRSSYLYPAEPVRIDLGTGETTRLRGPVERPEVPGTLERVETVGEDGQPVKSWLVLPQDASDASPVPALLWIHGGPLGSWNAWTWRWSPWLLAAKGYAVLLPDPALSTGYGQHMIDRGWGQWGGAPYTDLMAATDALVQRADIDESRVAAMGGSFGGYMANWVAGHTDRFTAIVTHASLWALDQFGPTTDTAYYWKQEMTPDMLRDNSPHHSVGNINTPMLVIHGDKDYRVPIGEGLRLWYELLSASKLPANDDGTTVHRFLYFPDENHWILKPQHTKVWYGVVEAFLARHVLGEEKELPPELGL